MKSIEIQLNRDFCKHLVANYSGSVPLFYLNRDLGTISSDKLLRTRFLFGLSEKLLSSKKLYEVGKLK